jgi:hypothetical protein
VITSEGKRNFCKAGSRGSAHERSAEGRIGGMRDSIGDSCVCTVPRLTPAGYAPMKTK